MIRIGVLNSSWIEGGRRIIKSFVRSKKDVHTSFQTASWGDDSNPVESAKIIHAETSTDETIILGVINTGQKCAPGEKRIFATNASGDEVVDIYLRNDGTIEIAGIGDNIVKYTPLNTALTNYNNALNAELAKIAAAIPSGGYVPLPLTINISGAKSSKLKTE